MKPILVDLFCKAGGATKGYQRAGFHVIGVDIEPQPRYCGDAFVQMDALEAVRLLLEGGQLAGYGLNEIDVIAASPVCKGYTKLAALYPDKVYPDDIAELRQLLQATGKPYVIENVPGAPLKNALMLCGSMFGLRVYRHRLFECNPPLMFSPKTCNHWARASASNSKREGKRITPSLANFQIMTITGHDFILADARLAMGIDWMSQAEISQAIPPAYTEWLGQRLMEYIP